MGVIVAFQPGHTDPQLLTSAGLEIGQVLPGAHLISTRMTGDEQARMARHPAVRFIELDRTVHAAGLRGSLSIGAPWMAATPGAGSGEITWGVRAVQAPEVWDVDEDGELDPQAPAGQGIKVCVLDSGVDLRHPEIMALYAGGKDFVDNDDDPSDASIILTDPLAEGGGHGTHVAGTIAARYGHGGAVDPSMSPGGVVGVAPAASILVARVLGVDGSGDSSTIIRGMDWCVSQGAKILNLSLGSEESSAAERGGGGSCGGGRGPGDCGLGQRWAGEVGFPAAFPNAIAVGAVDRSLQRADFSQFGPALDFVGPGVDVLSSSALGAGGFAARRSCRWSRGDCQSPLRDRDGELHGDARRLRTRRLVRELRRGGDLWRLRGPGPPRVV